MPMHYTNPRTHVVVDDWPHGRQRTTATFTVETHPTRGQRGVRQTINPKTGEPAKPKTLTYADRVTIVDGDDGRLYFAELCGTHISIMQATMQLQQECIWPRDPRFAVLFAMLTAKEDEG